ncbi:TIGR03089 family protein [Micromonospora pattaloongensis]|uniref:TIGR03089 family protein n=1 Tax=Micromonospora pattaloongensis TaxID=405436 RepID=A0A1H3NYM0_9ACTN|nr:TIGR03089 family protein [Micromonospora pattaloongensis]SDY93984.1 TIGR03089 family protein [Micromonospora pattaloongensis]
METITGGVPSLLAGAVGERDRPLVTYYDDATGERAELTVTELAGWAARTAGLLHAGCGLGAGSRAAILLPPHWQTAAVLLGAWSAGVSVSFRGWATAGLPALGPGVDEPFDATFVARDRVDSWLDEVPEARHRFVLGLAPGGAPIADVPTGYRDYVAEVRDYPDSLPGYAMIGRTDAASVDGTTFRQWGSLAHALAETLDLRAGDRLLVDAAAHEHPVKWLLAPLAVGASVVLCANLDRAAVDARVAAERVTRVL